MAGIVRIDIPLPVIANEDELWYDATFTPNIGTRHSHHHNNLKNILEHAFIERYPIPRGDMLRTLTEYYPIYETELWIKSQLKDVSELVGMIT